VPKWKNVKGDIPKGPNIRGGGEKGGMGAPKTAKAKKEGTISTEQRKILRKPREAVER